MTAAAILAFFRTRIGLGLLAALALGIVLWRVHAWHEGKVEALVAETVKARDAEWRAKLDAQRTFYLNFIDGYERRARELAAQRKQAYDQDLRRIAADADALRLRGPGRAAATLCRPGGDPGPAAGADRPAGRDGQPGNAPLAPLPEGEAMAIVPWADTVRWAESHDWWRATALMLWDHLDEQNRLLIKAKRDLPRPEFGN